MRRSLGNDFTTVMIFTNEATLIYSRGIFPLGLIRVPYPLNYPPLPVYLPTAKHASQVATESITRIRIVIDNHDGLTRFNGHGVGELQ